MKLFLLIIMLCQIYCLTPNHIGNFDYKFVSVIGDRHGIHGRIIENNLKTDNAEQDNKRKFTATGGMNYKEREEEVEGKEEGEGNNKEGFGSGSDVCISEMAMMPKSWRPPSNLEYPHSLLPWSHSEQLLLELAVNSGVDEMVTFLDEKPQRIHKLGLNTVSAFMSAAYAAPNRIFAQQSLELAFKYLKIVAKPLLVNSGNKSTCKNIYKFLVFSTNSYEIARRLDESESAWKISRILANRTNAALRGCKDLKMIIKFDPKIALSNPNANIKGVFRWLMWSVVLAGGLSNPQVMMPKGSSQFVGDMWHYVATYPVPLARDYANGMNNSLVQKGGYFMTHVALFREGYGRHALNADEAPWLYHYIRENFYPVMERKGLDLMAEFISTLRKYRCNEESDAQLRHGSRYLLHLYKEAGHAWMQVRRDKWRDPTKISDYNLFHKPWTAVGALKPRHFEPIVSGSYGATFEKAIKASRLID